MNAVGVAIIPPRTFVSRLRAFPSSDLVGSTGISRIMLRYGFNGEKISMLVISAFAQDSLLPLPSPSDTLLGVYGPIDSHCLKNHRRTSHPSPETKAQSFHLLHPQSSCLAHNRLTNLLHLPFRLPWRPTPLQSLILPTPWSFLLRWPMIPLSLWGWLAVCQALETPASYGVSSRSKGTCSGRFLRIDSMWTLFIILMAPTKAP